MSFDRVRETALKVLYDVDKKGVYSNLALNSCFNEYGLKGKDRAFVTNMVYGVLQMKLSIDWIIEEYSNIKLNKISPYILNILRMGIYQLKYMDRVPEFAACNESVSLAVKYGGRKSAGYVNGMLRTVIKKTDNLKFPGYCENSISYLSLEHSFPQELVKMWVDEYGREFTIELLKSLNSKPLFTIRANTLKTSAEELLKKLNEKGYQFVRGKYVEQALNIKNPEGILNTEEYAKGLFTVQDESSMLASLILDPHPSQTVADVCSAPGGKMTHIAQLMQNRGRILSGDIYPDKVELLKQTAKRMGVDIGSYTTADACILNTSVEQKADRVLIDAPCSGLGIIRRKPEIKWRFDARKGLNEMQFKILCSSSRYLKPGGIMVYSTCTINSAENTQTVEKFLSQNKDFVYDIKGIDSIIKKYGIEGNGKGYIQLFPNIHNVDGFFIARLRKI